MITRTKDILRIEVYDEDGKLIDYRQTGDENPEHGVEDLITDAGLADVVRMIAERYNYLSVGTGTTATEHDDTGMEAECMDRATAATSISTTFYANDTVEFRGTFTPASNYSITESGIHYAATSSGDTMYARETFPAIAVTSGIPFQVAFQIIQMR